ncbi:MAG: protease modulator HflC [Planctomycetota bacterium]|jgi:membrane protease subunit HflC
MKRAAILIIGVLLLIWAASTVFFQVEETEYVIVKLFGDPWRVESEPGLKIKWPWPVEERVRIDKRVKTADILDTTAGGMPRESEYLTRDKKNVLVNFFVAWRVKNPLQFLVSVNDEEGAESRLSDILRSEMGAELGQYNLSDLVSTGELESTPGDEGEPAADALLRSPPPGDTRIPEIMDNITERTAAAALREFGIEVLGVRMKRLNFPRQNKQAVFERMEAERERIAIQYRAEGKEQADKLIAEADRRKEELINEANRKAEEIRGKADAEATKIYAESYGKDPEFYEFYQYLETYKEIMDEEDILVIPADSPLLKLLKEGG